MTHVTTCDNTPTRSACMTQMHASPCKKIIFSNMTVHLDEQSYAHIASVIRPLPTQLDFQPFFTPMKELPH